MSNVQLTIDGLAVTVPEGTTVFDAARMQGISIPTLCHQQNETPVGVCRVCVVDVGGRSVGGVLRTSSRKQNGGFHQFRQSPAVAAYLD